MSDQPASFIGSIPENYDRGLGPVFFTDFAEDMARRAAASPPRRGLETCAGTGIVTRRLRDLFPASTQLVATDLDPPMLEIPRGEITPGATGEIQPAGAA